jgi:hypothetical protein
VRIILPYRCNIALVKIPTSERISYIHKTVGVSKRLVPPVNMKPLWAGDYKGEGTEIRLATRGLERTGF